MIKNYTLLFLLILGIIPASARLRTRQEIQSIAQRLITTTNDCHRANVTSEGRDKAQGELKEVAATANYTVMAYDQGGFAIIANDDACSPVIGYSSSSPFSTSNPALTWFLTLADAALASDGIHAPRTSSASIPTGCKEEVGHLVETKWNQDDPYWDMCPKDGTGKRCYTGCVATAMAQIMRYYKYPTTGKGNATVYYNNQQYNVNFATARYDYDNMLTSYANSYTAAQKMAVARLMYHCGVAAKMEYGTNGSGAYLKDAADGLFQHFGYITKYYGLRDDLADNLKNNVWREVVYQELSDGHPILYAGTSNKNGNDKTSDHAFVLDGYDKDGNVGVNWGYGGSGDGYFSLDILECTAYNPSEEYRWWQQMVVIHTPEAGGINNGLNPTGIESITTPRPTNDKKYDLSGREITMPIRGTVYIENGKKLIKQ